MRTIHHFRGDTFIRDITITASGTPVNLTGSSVVFSVKNKFTDEEVLLTATATIPTPTNGVAKINVSATDMEELPVGQYVYDFEYTDSIGTVRTLEVGTLAIDNEVTP